MTPCSGGGLRFFAITLTLSPLCFLPLHRYAAACAACGFRLCTDFDTAVAILAALGVAGLWYAVIPGGLTMFVQSIDTALAALYRTAHHRLYAAHMEGNPKVTAAQARNLFVEFCYIGHQNAVNLLDVPTVLQDLGYIDPTKLKLRVPFQFAIPQRAELPRGDASAPKPKPKPNPKPVSRQLSMSAFLSK